jgi:shikimate dehydrogenase
MSNKTDTDPAIRHDNETPTDIVIAPQNVGSNPPPNPPRPEPTRYGDWEKAGRCIDF